MRAAAAVTELSANLCHTLLHRPQEPGPCEFPNCKPCYTTRYKTSSHTPCLHRDQPSWSCTAHNNSSGRLQKLEGDTKKNTNHCSLETAHITRGQRQGRAAQHAPTASCFVGCLRRLSSDGLPAVLPKVDLAGTAWWSVHLDSLQHDAAFQQRQRVRQRAWLCAGP